MAKDLAIVLNSGSINSVVATALAAQRYRPVLLHALRGSTQGETDDMPSRARVAFDQQVAHFKPYREHTLAMPFLSLLNAPPPKQTANLPEVRQQSATAPLMLELLPLLAAAGRFASHYQVSAIYLGLRVGPSIDELAQATEYVQIWTDLLQLPCGITDLELVAPLMELEPWQVVDLAFQVNAPLERTWSCANDAGEPCWACRGCRAREAAFQRAGKPDPIRGTGARVK
jgi:7-cyano-7-deazaguanine synthase in queuosine biosynthesis